MSVAFTRQSLPRPRDRLWMGRSGLRVSPFCLGVTRDARTVLTAYEAGINFFFLSADLHWPLYESTRRGIAELLASGKARREDIVVCVASYLDEPLFSVLQFQEVIDSVPGLERVDVLAAGAVSKEHGFLPRVNALSRARSGGHVGSRAIGASFHQRPYALLAANANLLDISFVRYNSGHPGARRDLFPFLHPHRTGLVFNFKSTMSYVSPRRCQELGLLEGLHWLPSVPDYYRFVLSRPQVDGLLISPSTPAELESLLAALDKGPLRPHEEEYMISLAATAHGTHRVQGW